MKIASPKEFIFSKEEIAELFISKQIKETNYGWVYNNHKIDIMALHPKEIKYIENLHKAEQYKIVYKN